MAAIRPRARPEPPAVGSALPPLRLDRPRELGALVLLGLKGKVVWVVFWSAGSASGREGLPGSRTPGSGSGRTRSSPWWPRPSIPGSRNASARPSPSARSRLPVYLAGPETCRRFGVDRRRSLRSISSSIPRGRSPPSREVPARRRSTASRPRHEAGSMSSIPSGTPGSPRTRAGLDFVGRALRSRESRCDLAPAALVFGLRTDACSRYFG